ncbi:MAG: LamG domain-containing protein, partial [Candidatus Cloacimonetes bacterium]|nr:LamG domain-containing protein [Candidatus Cloacimonadota bacterium]
YIVSGWFDTHILSNDGGAGNGIPVGAGAEDGNWHHIAMTWKQNTTNGFVSYLNGEIVAHRNSSNSPIPNINANLKFGSYNEISEFMDGSLDEVRIWNVARDSTQIRENMYLPLNETETGLVSYWQFNEGSGETANDIIGENHGTLTNMDTLNCWIDSTIPFGYGESGSQTETAGTVDFISTGLSMYFNSQNEAEITVTRIDTLANINPDEPDEVFDAQYWVVNRFGSGTFDADLTFTMSENLTVADETDPSYICLYTRVSNADTDWVYLTEASSVSATTDEVTFDGITDFSQFIIGRWIQSLDSPQNVTAIVNGGNIEITWDAVTGANSYKIFAADIPDGTFIDITNLGTFNRCQSGSFRRQMTKSTSQFNELSVTEGNKIKDERNRVIQTWSASADGIKKFYYVIASSETVRNNVRSLSKPSKVISNKIITPRNRLLSPKRKTIQKGY